jgi:hypothetical protein
MEFIVDGKYEIIKQKVLRRNDPQTKQPALVMLWNVQTGEYRTYFPTQPHDPWPQGSTTQTTNAVSAAIASPIKPVEPPVHLNGVVDATMAGLWKGTLNNIDYYLDIKPDGTYFTYSSSNSKQIKSYWRINGNYLEMFSDGMKQPSKFLFAKVNDLQKGKPTITFDGFAYFSETPREMWK